MPDPIQQNEDHIGGNFEWEKPPECSCGMLRDAIETEQFLFVSNMVGSSGNAVYMMPVMPDGSYVRSNGVVISHCPWCGDKIEARKKYA